MTYFDSSQDEGTVVEVEKDILGIRWSLCGDLGEVDLQKFQSYEKIIV